MSTELPDIDTTPFEVPLELCSMDGAEAANTLRLRVFDPNLLVTVGGAILNDVVDVDHNGEGGLRVLCLMDDTLKSVTFSAEPEVPFTETARDDAGNLIFADPEA